MNKYGRKFISCLFVLILFSTPLGAQEIREGEILTLERCLELALRNNPSIVGARANLRLYETKINQAKANYYPQVTWDTQYSRVGPYSDNLSQYNSYATNIGLSQNIFDFQRTPLKVEIAKINTQSVARDLENIETEVANTVKQAFYSLLQAQKNKGVAEETFKNFDLHLKQAKGFYEAGTKPRIDVIKAEVDLSNARLNLIQAENAVRLARIALNNAMGIKDTPAYNISEELKIPIKLMPLSEAIREAYKNRHDLNSLRLKKEAANKSLLLAKKNYFPTVTGNAAYGFEGNEFPLGRGWQVGASVSIPIFSGFLTRYQVEEAKFNYDVITSQIENLENDIRRDVEQAYSNLIEAKDRINAAEKTLKYAKENADLATGRYNVGIGSPIEVTDALVALANAQTSYISALVDFKKAEAALEKAMGKK